MKILVIGDVVGKPGRDILAEKLRGLRESEKIDFVVANAENAAGGSGITPIIADELYGSGIDVITSGDHIWKKREIYEYLDHTDRLLRPLNYPKGAPGKGSTIIEIKNKIKVGVINLIGRVFMDALDCPFVRGMEEVERIRKITPVIIVDIHAEATSEKVALGWYFDGKISAIIGTHTHVQTADEKVLPGGTAYLTDSGMTGPVDSVIGRKKEQIIERFITQLPTRFEMATGDSEINGAIIDIDPETGKANYIKRVQLGTE